MDRNMKATELRIGNWVLDRNDFHMQVQSIDTYDLLLNFPQNEGDPFEYLISEIKPIPLTEEWLVRFGAKPDDLEIDSFVLSSITCDYRFFKSTLIEGDVYWTCEKVLGDTNIEYVHQLQNLYFALTGEELKLTDK